nr:HAD-IA family hydrolase [Streptacidiphilus carbonis]
MAITPDADARTFDALLCDLDGVVRFYDHSEVNRLERAAGLAEGATMRIAFAPHNDLPLLLGRISRERWAQAIAGDLLAHGLTESQAVTLGRVFSTVPSWVDPGVVDLLRRARAAGCTLVLVTNATTWLEQDLAALGIADLADHIVNSSLVGVAKPDPRIYRIAAERAAVPADRCLFVDDRQENIDAARAHGMTGLLYREPADLRTALAPLLTDRSG